MAEAQPQHERKWIEGDEIPVPATAEETGDNRDIKQSAANESLQQEQHGIGGREQTNKVTHMPDDADAHNEQKQQEREDVGREP